MELLTVMTTTQDDDILSASGLVDRSTAAADDVALWPEARSLPASGAVNDPVRTAASLRVA